MKKHVGYIVYYVHSMWGLLLLVLFNHIIHVWNRIIKCVTVYLLSITIIFIQLFYKAKCQMVCFSKGFFVKQVTHVLTEMGRQQATVTVPLIEIVLVAVIF